jgi:hypothetical protein
MAGFVVLAEDETDAEAIRRIVRRRLQNPTIRKFAGKGCARLRRKAEAWLSTVAGDGYDRAILIHDLDRDPQNHALNDPKALREQLNAIRCPAGITKLICIPVEELEAWFWSDSAVLAEIAGKPMAALASPHKLSKPKEKLSELSRGENRKPRYSTQDNARLAEMLDLELCASRCDSMRLLLQFIGRQG